MSNNMLSDNNTLFKKSISQIIKHKILVSIGTILVIIQFISTYANIKNIYIHKFINILKLLIFSSYIIYYLYIVKQNLQYSIIYTIYAFLSIIYYIPNDINIKNIIRNIITIFTILAILYYFIFIKQISFGNSNNKLYILLFGLIIVIFLVIKGLLNIKLKKKEINKDWENYKCKPSILPFAGWFIGPKNTSMVQNYKECTWKLFRSFGDILLHPVRSIFDLIFGILKIFNENIQKIRQVINYIREALKESIIEIANKLKYAFAKITQVFIVFLQFFLKIFFLFQSLFYILVYAFYTFSSLINGPIGKFTKFFCFDENTIITLNNCKKKIKDIDINDDINVEGILKFSSNNVEMYKYNNIILSGSHLVKENLKWIRVKDSLYSSYINNYNKPFIYCLITKNSKILINDIIVADYIETNNNFIRSDILNIVKKSLNNDDYMKYYKYYNDYNMWGFDTNTILKLNNNNSIKISDIKINDILENNNKVTGIIKLKPLSNMYYYNNNIISGTQLIFINNKWQYISEIDNIVKINNYTNNFIFNICTENGIININNNIFRDFEQISNETVNDYIDEHIINHLNT
jgi:hypothetical protein